MPNVHHNITDYAPPVLPLPSPPSSIGSEDLPLFEHDPDRDLNQDEFERKVVDALGLHKQRREEIDADRDPLIPKCNTPEEERRRYEEAMRFLRRKVAEVVDDELVDRTLLRGSQVGLEPQPSSTDIDSIMRSMMSTDLTQNVSITDGPWSLNSLPSHVDAHHTTEGPDEMATSIVTVNNAAMVGSRRK